MVEGWYLHCEVSPRGTTIYQFMYDALGTDSPMVPRQAAKYFFSSQKCMGYFDNFT